MMMMMIINHFVQRRSEYYMEMGLNIQVDTKNCVEICTGFTDSV
jgi:hypothetical protein